MITIEPADTAADAQAKQQLVRAMIDAHPDLPLRTIARTCSLLEEIEKRFAAQQAKGAGVTPSQYARLVDEAFREAFDMPACRL